MPGSLAIFEAQKQFNAELREAAAELWEEEDLIFPGATGTAQDPSRVNKRFHEALRHAHLPSVRVHDLRHTFATLAFSQRVSAREVQEILGHANVQTTLNTYTHVAPQMTRQAIHRMSTLLTDEPLDEEVS